MSERYKIEYYEDLLEISSIIDTVENHELTAEEIVDLLNELSEENEQLKKEVKQLKNKIKTYNSANELLKETIDRLRSDG